MVCFRARFLNNALIEKMFEGPRAIVIGNEEGPQIRKSFKLKNVTIRS